MLQCLYRCWQARRNKDTRRRWQALECFFSSFGRTFKRVFYNQVNTTNNPDARTQPDNERVVCQLQVLSVTPAAPAAPASHHPQPSL